MENSAEEKLAIILGKKRLTSENSYHVLTEEALNALALTLQPPE